MAGIDLCEFVLRSFQIVKGQVLSEPQEFEKNHRNYNCGNYDYALYEFFIHNSLNLLFAKSKFE